MRSSTKSASEAGFEVEDGVYCGRGSVPPKRSMLSGCWNLKLLVELGPLLAAFQPAGSGRPRVAPAAKAARR